MSSFYNQQGRENLNFWVRERQITKSQINLNIELKRQSSQAIEVLPFIKIAKFQGINLTAETMQTNMSPFRQILTRMTSLLINHSQKALLKKTNSSIERVIQAYGSLPQQKKKKK